MATAPVRTRPVRPKKPLYTLNKVPVRVEGIEGGLEADHRVYVGEGRVRLFRAQGREAVKVFEAALLGEIDRPVKGQYIIATDQGFLTVTQQGHCGCGSPLKSLSRRVLRGEA